MNRPWPSAGERLGGVAGREPLPLDTLESDAEHAGLSRRFLRITYAIIILFWIAQYSFLTTMLLIRSVEDAIGYLVPRAVVTSCGALFSLAILWVQLRVRHRSLRLRSLIAGLLALAGATAHSLANELTFLTLLGSTSTLRDFAWNMFSNLWLYTSMSVILLALTYAFDLREREMRIAALRDVANAAQLRALRFQLNPHFLFNALNSIASLISRARNREAETMTECLSDFLRSTMRLDPVGEIPLGEEIALQSLYLEIEKARFPERLVVELDVPGELGSAMVPNLITQPLIENAVKFAVARSTAPVTLRISARREGNTLVLAVADDGGDAERSETKGSNIGLANVAERLRLHFGDEGSLAAGPLAPRGFQAELRLPLRFGG